MTEIELMQRIKSILDTEIIPHIGIFKDDEIKVFLHDIPMSSDFETDDSDDEKYFPCCIVRLNGGEISNAGEPQKTAIEIIVCIKDWSENMSGYQNLIIILNRIRDYFTSNYGIRNKFRLQYPVKTGISDETATPYFVGNITTNWIVDIKPYEDINKFL